MRVLVTGGSGRLGFYVARELEQAGHAVTLFDRRPPPPELRHLPFLQADTTAYDDCRRALERGFDAIQHLAAQPYPADHPALRAQAEADGVPFDATLRSNLLGTYYLLHAAVAAGVGTFVMTGSNCALGNGFRISRRPFPYRYLPVDEAHPSDVEDSYSFGKLAVEELLHSYTCAYGLRTYVLRSAAICDAAQRRENARHASPARELHPVLWSWVASEDLAAAHRLLMECAGTESSLKPDSNLAAGAGQAPHDGGFPSHAVYFCCADDTSALEPTCELIQRFLPDVPLTGDLPGHSALETSLKLRAATGWQHKTSWRDYL